MKTSTLISAFLLAISATGLAQTTFTSITTGEIVSDLGTFTRPVWGDFNSDGFLDLFVSNFSHKTNVFYLNNRDGTFTKRTEGEPVRDADYHSGAAGGDYDNDGNLDLVVSAGVTAPTARGNTLYHNSGNGVFSRESGGSLTNELGFFDACAWADYDNDGFLDLVITDIGNGAGGRTLLFRNLGDGTFTRMTAVGVDEVSRGQGVLWADYDGDGNIDLTVINTVNSGRNVLYHNNGNGTFEHVSTNVIASDVWTFGANSGAWGDYDNDGLLDLFVVGTAGTTNRLYHNEGNGRFTTVGSGPMLQPLINLQGCAWGDYDNDGYLDLFVTDFAGSNRLFHNNGEGTFTQVFSEPFLSEINCMSGTWVDYDNDGSLDLFLTRAVFDGSLISNRLYHNDGSTNSWLEVRLVGTVANRSAIGAKVRVKATIGGKPVWQLREINNGGGWNVQTLVAHFGLGDSISIENLRIEWPSGTVQEFANLPGKQHLTIFEPARLTAARWEGLPQFTLLGGRNLQYDVQTSADLKTWSLLGSLTISNLDGSALITDPNAPTSGPRFYHAVSRASQ